MEMEAQEQYTTALVSIPMLHEGSYLHAIQVLETLARDGWIATTPAGIPGLVEVAPCDRLIAFARQHGIVAPLDVTDLARALAQRVTHAEARPARVPAPVAA